MPFDGKSLDDYIDVAERIDAFYDKYPDGSLQPRDPDRPYVVQSLGDKTFIVYTACAYRKPGDEHPGVGVAWEPFPGRTPYTRDSEVMNAETSAWGRAIAALGIATKRGIATRQEIRNRHESTRGADQRAGQYLEGDPEAPRPAAAGAAQAGEKQPPDEKEILAQDLAIMAYKIAADGLGVDMLRAEVYDVAKSQRLLRTTVIDPFDETGNRRVQLSAIITHAKNEAAKGDGNENSDQG